MIQKDLELHADVCGDAERWLLWKVEKKIKSKLLKVVRSGVMACETTILSREI